MAKYSVDVKPSALKELARLPASVVERIFSRIENLALEPRPVGSKKLKGGRKEWRIRIGDYRAVYTIDDSRFQVSVTRVRHRKDVYED